MAAGKPAARHSSASAEIDAIIAAADGWKGETMAALRAAIRQADASILEEVKWKKPSKPEGVAVWANHGNLCHVDLLKHAVRLNFHQGAQIKDPKGLFNTRLDSNTVRAIDFAEGQRIPKTAIQGLVREAVRLNQAKASK